MTDGVARVLVVDDEPAIADSLVAILRLRGYEAVGAYNAAGALELSRTAALRLLLSDISLAGEDGVELALRVRAEHPNCAILLFSGQPAADRLLAAARERGQEFEVLAKPVNPVHLLSRIAALCA